MPQGNVAAGLPNRGKTYHGGTPTGTIGRSINLEGAEIEFEDDIKQPARPDLKRSSRTTLCRLVRNTAGFNLEPKRAVSWEAGYRGTRVDGYCEATAAECAGIVDDQLPSAGVEDDDLFWVMRKGPGLVLTDLAGGANNVVAEGALVIALTAATSGATTAGRATDGAVDATNIYNRIGKAMSAVTTGNTNADLLVDLDLIN